MDVDQVHAWRAQAIAHLLKRHRQAAELSQEELAARAGVSVRSISNIERGVPHRPRKDTLRLLADALALADDDRATFLAAAHPAHVGIHAALTTPDAHAPALPGPQPDAGPSTAPSAPLPLPLPPLPVPPTRLIGREREVADALAFLHSDHLRLLTVCGPPGVGKTHLALEVAHAVASAAPPLCTDGVAFVDLAPLRDWTLVGPTMLVRLGIQLPSGASWQETLHAALRQRRLLLVLDNVEHVAPAAPLVAELLAVCPYVRVLATSRVPLHLRGEQRFPVAPLPIPDPAVLPPLDELARVPAVALLLQRTTAILPDFALIPANAPAIAAICARLDGLPLALELAAPRLRADSPTQLLARLSAPLRVLVDGACDLPPRQQTLRYALSWSYELLSAAEQAVFRQLAVFSGGFDLPAVAAVCAPHGPAPHGQPALDQPALDQPDQMEHCLTALTALAEQSLLVRSDQRWRMLETVREFAAEQLRLAGDLEPARQRHAAYFRDLAETAEGRLTGPEAADWLDRLDRELHNLRASLEWSIGSNHLIDGLRLAGALWRFWDARGYLSEGRAWLDRLFALCTDFAAASDPDDLRDDARMARDCDDSHAPYARALAGALNAAGILAWRQGDHAQAQTCHERALALRRALDDPSGIAASLNNLGTLASERGHYAQAEALYAECLVLRRREGNLRGIAVALNNLSSAATLQGQYLRAVPLLEESLALRRQLGDRRGEALALANLGEIARNRGDVAHAEALCTHSLSLWRTLANEAGASLALGILGDIALDRGDHTLGAGRYRERLALCHHRNDRTAIAQCLQGLARAAAGTGQAHHAARLLGSAAALRDAVGVMIRPFERAEMEAVIARVQAALGHEDFVAEWQYGSRLALDAAVALALDDAQAAHSGAAAHPEELPPNEAALLSTVSTGAANSDV